MAGQVWDWQLPKLSSKHMGAKSKSNQNWGQGLYLLFIYRSITIRLEVSQLNRSILKDLEILSARVMGFARIE